MNKQLKAELDAAAKEHTQWRRWTRDEDEVVEAYFGKVPIGLLARKLGRTTNSVKFRRQVLLARGT